jgi:hypothetical protein
MPAAASAGNDHPLPVGEQLRLRTVQPRDDRAGRDGKLLVLAALSVLALPLAVLPAARPEVLAAAERGEIAAALVADQHHISPAPAVAAIGPAARDVRLAPEADGAVAAATALNLNLGSVEEHAPTLAGACLRLLQPQSADVLALWSAALPS